MMWLVGAIGWLKGAFTALVGVITRYPLHAALVAALVLSAWFYMGKHHALAERDVARAHAAQILAASKEAERLAIAAREATELRYRNIANAIDKEHEKALADAGSAASRYISLHKVGKCAASQAPASSKDRSAESGERSGSEAIMVAVSEADIHICTENTTRMESVRDWALSLNQ